MQDIFSVRVRRKQNTRTRLPYDYRYSVVIPWAPGEQLNGKSQRVRNPIRISRDAPVEIVARRKIKTMVSRSMGETGESTVNHRRRQRYGD